MGELSQLKHSHKQDMIEASGFGFRGHVCVFLLQLVYQASMVKHIQTLNPKP